MADDIRNTLLEEFPDAPDKDGILAQLKGDLIDSLVASEEASPEDAPAEEALDADAASDAEGITDVDDAASVDEAVETDETDEAEEADEADEAEEAEGVADDETGATVQIDVSDLNFDAYDESAKDSDKD